MHIDRPSDNERPISPTSINRSNTITIDNSSLSTDNRRRAPRIEIEDILGGQRVVGNTVFYTGDHPNHPNRARPGHVRRSVQEPDHIISTDIAPSAPPGNDSLPVITSRQTDSVETATGVIETIAVLQISGPDTLPSTNLRYTSSQTMADPKYGHMHRKDRAHKPTRLDPDLLKSREDDVMHNLVLEYLSDRCFPATARILSEGLSTASSSNSSSSTPKEPPSNGTNGSTVTTAQSRPLEIDTDVTMMSSSISELASIIDPSIIATTMTNTTPGTAVDSMRESTIVPSVIGWPEPQSAGSTVTNGNGKTKAGGHEADIDVDMDLDGARPARPELSRKHPSMNDITRKKNREAWIMTIEWRKEIRDSIRSGDIVRGMDLLRRYFPSVLQNYGSTGSKAEYKTIPADGDAADETDSHASSWDDGSESNDSDGSGESASEREESDVDEEETYRVPGHDEMASTTSVAFPGIKTGVTPASLYLNLEIQSFIENVRQLEASSDADMDFSSMASSMHSEMAATDGLKNGKTALSSFAPSRDSTSSPDLSARPRNGDVLGGSSSKSSRTLACVAQAQKLYAEATNYLSEDAAEPFINTIESVTALLAYTDMASSPLKCWLDTKRRFTLAETVNSAILVRSNPDRQYSRSRLETIARQASVVVSTCKSRGFDVSPPWKVDKEGIAMASLANMVTAKQSFDLRTFLSER